jgi:hypothetical protein
VIDGWEGKSPISLLFNALDPMKGKGELLGKIAVDRAWIVGWGLSPDGLQVAVVDHSHKDRIEVLNLSTHAWREVTVEPGHGDFHDVPWAADGISFFITTVLPESFNIFRVGLSGKVELLLTNPRTQSINRPRPSPDGKHLAFQTDTIESNVWMLENF